MRQYVGQGVTQQCTKQGDEACHAQGFGIQLQIDSPVLTYLQLSFGITLEIQGRQIMTISKVLTCFVDGYPEFRLCPLGGSLGEKLLGLLRGARQLSIT